MKKIFIIVLLFPLLARAQDCKLNIEKDPYNREKKFSTGFVSFNAGLNQFLLSVDADSREINFFFALNNAPNAICFDNSSTVSILFESSRSKANFRNTGTMNCEGLFHFTFRNTPETASNLQRLATKKVTTIIFTGNDKKVKEIILKEADQLLLMNITNCLVNEAKTLLK